MSVTTKGISTIGVIFSVGAETTTGTKPTTFYQLERINSIAGIEMSVETIDASALEDDATVYIAGRSDTGGGWGITVNETDETRAQWQAVITRYNNIKADGKRLWFQITPKGATNSTFVIAEPPQKLPVPEYNQNELLIVKISLTVVSVEERAEAITPTPTNIPANE